MKGNERKVRGRRKKEEEVAKKRTRKERKSGILEQESRTEKASISQTHIHHFIFFFGRNSFAYSTRISKCSLLLYVSDAM